MEEMTMMDERMNECEGEGVMVRRRAPCARG